MVPSRNHRPEGNGRPPADTDTRRQHLYFRTPAFFCDQARPCNLESSDCLGRRHAFGGCGPGPHRCRTSQTDGAQSDPVCCRSIRSCAKVEERVSSPLRSPTRGMARAGRWAVPTCAGITSHRRDAHHDVKPRAFSRSWRTSSCSLTSIFPEVRSGKFSKVRRPAGSRFRSASAIRRSCQSGRSARCIEFPLHAQVR